MKKSKFTEAHIMKNILRLFMLAIAAYFAVSFVSCKSLQHSIYYQESKFPNHLDSIQLNFINDSTVEVKSEKDSQTFKFFKLGNHYYKINANNNASSSPFGYLTTDTLVVKGHKVYFFSDDVKLVFNRKRK